ncbi:MAG TPA: SRPBCC family protein [Solirubrobacterales bacterium]|nr:SRPBCC family protein [Solirubrobacterales bacterium]
MSEQTDVKAELSTPGEREIHVERIFEAPRERVFAAYTDPELIPQWWGPYGTTTVVDEFEPRAGGRWRFVSQDSGGDEAAFRGVFREVVAPERIVWTFEWEGMPGHVSVETSRFEDLGDGRTKVIADTVFHTGAERDGMLDSGMERGMNETFARLDELLAA